MARLAELGNMYGADNPKIRSVAAALAATRANVAAEIDRMAKAAQNDVNAASSNVAALQKEVNNLSQAASASELTDLSKAQLQRETDADRQLYGDLLRRSKQIEIQRKIQQEPDARVASTSAASFTPSSPHRALLLAVSAGFFAMLSGGMTLFLDRSRFHSRSLLENRGDLPDTWPHVGAERPLASEQTRLPTFARPPISVCFIIADVA